MVTVDQTHMKEIEWLAGRGYNIMGVTFRVVYNGTRDRAVGPLLTVLWENLTDPILTGREQLGFSKIFCDMPDPVVCRGEFQVTGSWMGYRFLDMNSAQPAAGGAGGLPAARHPRAPTAF